VPHTAPVRWSAGRSGDLALLVYAVVALLEIGAVGSLDPVVVALLLGAVAALLLRRRAPLAGPVAAIALAWGAEVVVQLEDLVLNSAASFVLTLVGVGLLPRHGRRGWALVAVAAALPVATYLPLPPQQRSDIVLAPVAILVVAAASGGLTRSRRRLEAARAELVALREEGERSEVELLAADRRAVARDLHDIASHHLSIAALHASAARLRLEQGDADVAAVLRAVEDAGRAALQDLRPLLDVLGPGAVPAQRVPQPGTAQLPALVEQVRAAGLVVRADLRLARPLPAGQALVVYRVVQEGLTNALRHGRGTAQVTVAEEDGQVVVEVVNEVGRRRPGSGLGLVGLRERTGLYGGELVAGRAGRTWTLRAVLPAAPAPAATVAA
jgi:signal transduction histidine kinase